MNNHLKVLILSLLILLILFTIYMLLTISPKDTPIRIAPIDVVIQKSIPKMTLIQKPSDILLKLKQATEASKITISPQQKVKNKIIEEIINPKQEIISLKKEIKNVKNEMKKIKKEITSVKKEMTKKVVTIKKRKKRKKRKIRKIRKKKNKKKTLAKKQPIKVKIAHKKTFSDVYYFEPSKAEEIVENNTPLKFVETLGVVNVSNKYESTFDIPQKVEVAQEGIVNISTTNIETADMRELEFVDTLGVIEVSREFETINAKNYLE